MMSSINAVGPIPPEIAKAFVAMWPKLPRIDRTKTGKIPTKSGGEYSYNYADLADVLEAVKEVLAAHGLAVLTPVQSLDLSAVGIYVVFLHQSGESCTFGPLAMPASTDHQRTGSAITYGRRYAVVAALGIATEDDDDAASAALQSSARRAGRPAQTKAAGAHTLEQEVAKRFSGLTPDQKSAVNAAAREAGIGNVMRSGDRAAELTTIIDKVEQP